MYLKSIELENFKSFGGKVSVPLKDGYMAVTGPNGSGKSNIGDAIMFVLGPRSPKAVRAAKIPDLVFSAVGKGKADYMKATLVFENIDRILPWDADEVRLTRLIKLKGANKDDYSSYFYINDQPARLADFENLLSKARISADGYNIVQQGDVTHIIQMGPVERRRILDGISGISSYDNDLSRAASERNDAETSLNNIGIISTARHQELDKLEKERADALRYQEASAKLSDCKAQLSVRQRDQEKASLESLRSSMDETSKKIEERQALKNEVLEEQAANRDALAAKEAEMSERTGPEYDRVKTEVEQAKVSLGTVKNSREVKLEQAAEKEEVAAELRERIGECAENRTVHQANLENYKASLEDVKARKAAADKVTKEISAEINTHGGELTSLQQRIQDLDKEIDGKNAEYQGLETKAASTKAVMEAARESKKQAEDTLEAAKYDLKNAEFEAAEVAKTNGGDSVEDINKALGELAAKEIALSKQETELREIHMRKNSQLNKAAAEKAAHESVNGGGEAYNRILSLKATGQIRGIHGAICDLFTVEPGFETAVGIAAGNKARVIVVDDDGVAAACIRYLNDNRLGRVTFIPLNKIVVGRPGAKAMMVVKQTLGYVKDYVRYDPRYAAVAEYAFGDTLVAADIDKARAIMGGVRIVTKGGELFEKSGAITGGTVNTKNMVKFGSAGASNAEIDNLSAEVQKAAEAVRQVTESVKAVREQMRTLEDRMRAASKAGAEGQRKIAQAQANAEAARKALEKAKADVTRSATDFQTSISSNDQARKEADAAGAALQALRDELASCRDRLAEIAPADLQERIEKARNESYQLSLEENDISAEIKVIEVDLNGIATMVTGYEAQIAKAVEDAAALRQEAAGMDAELERLSIELQAKEAVKRDLESGQETLRKQREDLLKKSYELNNALENIMKDAEVDGSLLLSKKAAVQKSEERLAELEEEVAAIVGPIPVDPPSEETIKRNIRAAEGEIDAIGTVNLRAIEDYDITLRIIQEMDAEVDELNKRIQSLKDLEANISSKKKEIFMEAYDAVDRNFKALFAELSGGGEAYMSLEDPDDPFNGGLHINAKPRNGMMLRLEALSGGEKSLTALAFIFAIQEYQPSPFYVLDEVDMFLDAVNTELVASHIKTQSGHTQFIQVSLRKVALTKADNLIGVTRPPSGISKIIMEVGMQDLDKLEEEARKRQADASKTS